MVMEVKLPKEIELKIKKDKNLEGIIKRKIEKEMSRKVKEDAFFSMLFDSLLEDSKLTDEDIDEVDHKIKEGIMESLEWK